MLNFLSRTWVLAGFFVAMLAIGYSFSFVQTATGGELLDMVFTEAKAKARLDDMSADQKRAHLWATLINDTAYPLAYGGLFAGLIWRFAGSRRRWFVIPALAVIVADLAENATHALALTGNDALIGLKDFLTPAKFGLFLLAAICVLASLVLAAARRVRKKPAES